MNDLHALISPVPKGTPLPLVLLGKVMLLLAFRACFFFPKLIDLNLMIHVLILAV